MKLIKFLFFAFILITLAVGCATSGKQNMQGSIEGPGEKLLWQSAEPRPAWTLNEPDFEGSDMFFVGLSANVATEQLSREDAMRNATKNVVKYVGVLAKDKFEKLSTSFGLAADVVNPTEVRNSFEKQVSAGMAKNLKSAKWYIEKWDQPTGVAWKTFVLAKMPKSAIDESFKDVVDNQILVMKQKQKEANDEIAKKQLDKAIEAMKKMKEAGIGE